MSSFLEIDFEMTKYDNCKDTLFDIKSGFHLFLIFKYIKILEKNSNHFIRKNHFSLFTFSKKKWDNFTNTEKDLWEKCCKTLNNNTSNNYITILAYSYKIISEINEKRKFNSYEGILSRKKLKVINLIERIKILNSYDVFSDDEYEHRELEIDDLYRQLSEAKNDLYSFYSS